MGVKNANALTLRALCIERLRIEALPLSGKRTEFSFHPEGGGDFTAEMRAKIFAAQPGPEPGGTANGREDQNQNHNGARNGYPSCDF